MKVVILASTLALAATTASAHTSWAPRGLAALQKEQPNELVSAISNPDHLATAVALQVPGGGVLGTPFTHDGVIKFLAGYCVFHGLMGAAGANAYWGPMGATEAENSVAAWAAEHIG
jgi:hypothetical protein